VDFVILDADGGQREVRVERSSSGYTVSLDGRSFEVDHAALGPSQRSLIIEGRQLEVGVLRESRGRYRISSAAGDETLEVRDPLDHLAQMAASDPILGTASVTAYMHGRVVGVLVGVGDRVAAGQGVVVLEAMKMENEIQTEIDGVVKEIFVESGQSVEGGDPLFEIEPD